MINIHKQTHKQTHKTQKTQKQTTHTTQKQTTHKQKPKTNKQALIKTLKNEINRHIFKKKDICCEGNIDRNQAIDQIINLYKGESKTDKYLDRINNDLVLFIGYGIDLHKNKNINGVTLHSKLNKLMYVTDVIGRNGTLSLDNIKLILHNVPLYYLLSFLGYAYYKRNQIFPSFNSTNSIPNGPLMKKLMGN